MATITKTPSKTWKAMIRKRGWPTTIKTFRTKRDALDWARRAQSRATLAAAQARWVPADCKCKTVTGRIVAPG